LLSSPAYRFFFPFDFFEPDGNTLATVLAIELAIFATTPFLELRFFAFVVFDLVFVALLVLDFGLVVAAFFAITDSGTAFPLQIMLIRVVPYRPWRIALARHSITLRQRDVTPNLSRPCLICEARAWPCPHHPLGFFAVSNPSF